MSSIITLKRSSVAGKVPSSSNVSQGELALNTQDGRLYSSNGTDVFEVGASPHSLSVGAGGFNIANGALAFPTSDGSANQFIKTDGSGSLSFGTPSPSRQAIHIVTSDTLLDSSDHDSAVIVNTTNNVTIELDESTNLVTGDKFTILPVKTTTITIQLDGTDYFMGSPSTSTLEISVMSEAHIQSFQDRTIDSETGVMSVASELHSKIEILYVGGRKFVLVK